MHYWKTFFLNFLKIWKDSQITILLFLARYTVRFIRHKMNFSVLKLHPLFKVILYIIYILQYPVHCTLLSRAIEGTFYIYFNNVITSLLYKVCFKSKIEFELQLYFQFHGNKGTRWQKNCVIVKRGNEEIIYIVEVLSLYSVLTKLKVLQTENFRYP